MKRLILGVFSLAAGFPLFASAASDICVQFSELTPLTLYHVKDTFISSGVNCEVEPFQWSFGQWTSNGAAVAQSNSLVSIGPQPPHLWMNNVNVRLDVGLATDISLRYGAFGGNLNLRVNGALTNFGFMGALHGKALGGVTLTINPSSSSRGELRLSGIIADFAIGGQEFGIDDVCISPYTGPKFRGINVTPSGGVTLTLSYPGVDPSRLVLKYANSLDPLSDWLADAGATIVSTSENWFQATTTRQANMNQVFYQIELSPP